MSSSNSLDLKESAVLTIGLPSLVFFFFNFYNLHLHFYNFLSCNILCPNFRENIQKKREDYIIWHDYFMATAFLAAKRSKDPSYQVGACIVNKENVIVGIG